MSTELVDITELATLAQQQGDTIDLLQERIAELEFAQEDAGWIRIDSQNSLEFSGDYLRREVRRARLMYLKNPIVNHAAEVQAHYVFGQGVTIEAEHPLVDEVVQGWWDDPSNRAVLTTQQALITQDIELEITGNLFFALFTNASTGRVQVRAIPLEEIVDIICNPDDSKEPWFYKRTWRGRVDGKDTDVTAYYPDWRFSPAAKAATHNDKPVMWGAPIYHVKVGGFQHMRYGVPGVYSALDWATAVKQFHEDAATVRRAQARFAMSVTTKGGKAGVAAAKAKLGTTLAASNGTSAETNPPPVAGSTFVAAEGYALQMSKLAGNAPPADEALGLMEMAAAGIGIPVTMVFGKADIGNLATAKTLDRPTELKMKSRQTLWKSVLTHLADYAVDQAVIASQGSLKALGDATRDGNTLVVTMKPDPAAEPDPTTGQREIVSRHIDLDFPDLLERDVLSRVQAVVAAAPLMPETAGQLVTRLLLTALGVDDLDEEMDSLYPEEDPEAADDDDGNTDDEDWPDQPSDPLESKFTEALRDMRAALVAVAERGD